MVKSLKFMGEAIQIFEGTDFVKLHQSLNGGDEAYGNEVLEKLKEAHKRHLGEHPVAANADDRVPFPAKFTENKQGTAFLGIGLCHVIPLKEDSFLYELLRGHLIQFASMMLPKEYLKMGCCPEDMLSNGEAAVVVYAGNREVSQKLTGGRLEEEQEEEQGETEEMFSQALQ